MLQESIFLNILKIKPVGKITPKKIKNITAGETILPNNIPNLIHNLFKGVNIGELSKPRTRNVIPKNIMK